MEHSLAWLRVHRWLAFAGGTVLLALYGALTGLMPQVEAAAEIYGDWSEQRAKVAEVAAWKEEKAHIEKRRKMLQERYEKLYVSLPRSQQMSVVLDQLHDEAAAHGLSLRAVRPGEHLSHARYDELPLDVELGGRFHEIGAFVDGVERSHYLMKVTALKVDRSGDDLGVLLAKVRLSVIILKEE